MYWLQIIVRFVSLLRLQSFSSTHDVVYNLRNTGQDNINSSILLLSICSLDAVIYQQSPWNLIWCAYQTRSGVCVCVCTDFIEHLCSVWTFIYIFSMLDVPLHESFCQGFHFLSFYVITSNKIFYRPLVQIFIYLFFFLPLFISKLF